MRDFDPIQYCADGMDITSSPYAEQDATEVRAWTETGDLIAAVEMDANGVRAMTCDECGTVWDTEALAWECSHNDRMTERDGQSVR